MLFLGCDNNVSQGPMKITFSLRPDKDRPEGYLRLAEMPETLFYRAYFADVEILDGENSEVIPSAPLFFLVSRFQDLLAEAFLSGGSAHCPLWDTGHQMSLLIEGDRLALEIPSGTPPLRYSLADFMTALRAMTFEFLWTVHDDSPSILEAKGLFREGSLLKKAADLVLSGRVSRSQ
jgi:hypothetical protein